MIGGMEITAVLERVERIGAVRADAASGRSDCESALVEARRLRAWVDASEADLARRLASMVSFPEQAIARDPRKARSVRPRTVMERAATLESTPAIAAALNRGASDGRSCGCDHPCRKDARTRPARTAVGPSGCAGRTSPSMRARLSSPVGCVTRPAASRPLTAWTSWNASVERPRCGRGWISTACGTSTAASIRSPVSNSTPVSASRSKRCSLRRHRTPVRPTR